MKNKVFLMGMVALLCVFGLVVVGCDDGAQKIEGDVNAVTTQSQASAPTGVTAEKLTASLGGSTTNFVVVKWTAAPNANGYTVFYKEDGKNTVQAFGGTVQNTSTYANSTTSSTTLTTAPNTDRDAWSCFSLYSLSGTGLNNWSGKKIQFGVRTTALNSNTANSGIAWSAAVQF